MEEISASWLIDNTNANQKTMKREKTTLEELSVVGLTTRTKSTDEMSLDQSKISKLAGSYLT